MTESLPQDVIDFLKAYTPPDELLPTDLTVKRAAEQWRVSIDTARGQLDRGVSDGKLTKAYKKESSVTGGRQVAVYSLVK